MTGYKLMVLTDAICGRLSSRPQGIVNNNIQRIRTYTIRIIVL